MKSLTQFLKQFFSNKGHHVFASLLISKICAFLASLLIIRILPSSEFGLLSIVLSVFALFTPFNGLGSTQSLLRFGALENDDHQRNKLSDYLFTQGFLYQLLISILFLAVGVFYSTQYASVFWMFVCFAIRLIGIYLLAHVQSNLRIKGNNKEFAKVGNWVNICTLLFTIGGAYFFGLKGYVLAMTLSPFLVLLWKSSYRFSIENQFKASFKKSVWSYALHSSGTAFLSDALFSLDILFLGYVSTTTEVANYKVALLLPANSTFLALSFMQSDFPLLAKNFQNKRFLQNYIFNYLRLFIPICVGIFGIGYFFREEIIQLFFGMKYHGVEIVFSVLLATFCGNMLMRNLFGNLLSAVGLMKANTYVSLISVALFLILAFCFQNGMSAFKMSVVTAITLTSSGVLLFFFFFLYFKKLK